MASLSLGQTYKQTTRRGQRKDLFYVCPVESTTDKHKIWYSTIPIGKHALQHKFFKMCQAAGIMGHKTNHNLRATATSEMFAQQVPEKIIQDRTEHRPLDMSRTYERSNEEQHRAVSSVQASHQAGIKAEWVGVVLVEFVTISIDSLTTAKLN